MVQNLKAVTWEAPEHRHIEKSTEWYWVVSIIALAGAIWSVVLGDLLFGLVILLAATVMIMMSHHKPRVMQFEVSLRGIRRDSALFPYGTLESFCIDAENPNGPLLIVKSKHFLMHLIIIPIPEQYIDEIEHILMPRLHTEHLEEPIAHRLLEILGF